MDLSVPSKGTLRSVKYALFHYYIIINNHISPILIDLYYFENISINIFNKKYTTFKRLVYPHNDNLEVLGGRYELN